MQLNTETKVRSSESSSNDSGVITDEPLCRDGEINVVATIKNKIDNRSCDNDFNEVSTCKIQNGDDKVHYTIATEQTKPNSSPESTHISIESIDEDAVDSSVIDSDSDIEDLPRNGNFIIEKLGQHMPTADAKNGIIIVKQKQVDKLGSDSAVATTTPRPQIGSIAVQNSTDITFGDKTFYQGPVTIKQFLLENNKWKPKDANGSVNGGFDGSDTDCKSAKINGNLAPSSKDRKFVFNTKAMTITGGIIFTVFLIITIILTAILLRKSKSLTSQLGDGDDSRINNPIASTIGEDNIGGGKVLRFISRAEWVAQPARHTLNDLELPAKRVIIAHTATEQCSTQASCTFHVRLIQTFHMESRNWDDISYNFLVGGDGAVYEGRGWNKEGAHTKGFNKKSICIAFIGTFTDITPPDRQLNVTRLLIEEGLRLKKLAPDYKLFGHRQLIPSESPGKKLYEIIQTWPHWSDDISDN